MNDMAYTTRRVESYSAPAGVQRSFSYSARKFPAPSGTSRPMAYGDRIHVRLTRVQPGGEVIADFFLDQVNDMTEVLGELRHYTRGRRGLTNLYVRNVTRGWSLSRPFMLYADNIRPGVSVTRPHCQPAPHAPESKPAASGRRVLPESIRLLFGDH